MNADRGHYAEIYLGFTNIGMVDFKQKVRYNIISK